MDIDALKTFLEVYRCRHFGQAARNLYISQSTVSARIKLIEERVGAPVFIRKRNDIQLTAAGQRLLNYAENIVTTWSRARQEIGIEQEDLIPFVVGAMPSLWDSVLNNWMSHIMTSSSDVVLNAEVHDQNALLRRVQDGTMDLAFLFDHPQISDLECRELMSLPLVMISTQNDIDIEQAFTSDYILVEWGSNFSVTHARLFQDMPAPRIRVGLGRIALDYLITNGGTAYMAEPMVEGLIKDGQLHLVKDAPVINRSVCAVFQHSSDKKALIDSSIEYFDKEFKSGQESIHVA